MKIEKYLNQLMDDIGVLIGTDPPLFANGNGTGINDDLEFDAIMEEYEDHCINQKGALISEVTGISQEQLPPPEQLSDQQLNMMNHCLIELLNHYRFYPEFPEQLPDRIKYGLLRNDWENFKAPLIDCNILFEFCAGNPEVCPMQEFCEECYGKKQGGFEDEGDQGPRVLISIVPEGESPDMRQVLRKMRSLPKGRFISGIFNYCDRWCERCSLNSYCSVFQLSQEMGHEADLEGYDRQWIDEVAAKYEGIIDLVEKERGSLNINAAELARNDGFNICLKDDLLYRPESRELLTIAEYYAKSLGEWFRETGEERIEEVIGNRSVFQTIVFFQTSIAVKMFRALIGEDEEEDSDPVQNDANGSAKAVMQMIRESLHAWAWVLMKRKELKNTGMKQIILLSDMLRGLQEKFPLAEEFIRPGFDEEESEWEFK